MNMTTVSLTGAALSVADCPRHNDIRAGADRDYYRIVILSDIHLPGNILPAKETALQTIASWGDVDRVVVIGDIVATGGSADQLTFAKQFLSRVSKPLSVVGGNHDYIYPDTYQISEETGHHLKERSPEARKGKLKRFRETWGLRELFYSEKMGNYLLVFLSPDDLVSNHYTQMSDRQLAWLDAELTRNSELPTIVFFHGPPEGTYASKKILEAKTPDSYNAEPAEKIREILLKNRQVFLWVAGHLHIGATNNDFNSEINLYEKQVWVVHNADMNGSSVMSDADTKAQKHDTIWTNSLFLFRDRVVVKTYDHKQRLWLENQQRTIGIPRGG